MAPEFIRQIQNRPNAKREILASMKRATRPLVLYGAGVVISNGLSVDADVADGTWVKHEAPQRGHRIDAPARSLQDVSDKNES